MNPRDPMAYGCIGGLLMLTGIVFIIIGILGLRVIEGVAPPPRHLWCLFVGAPLFTAGIYTMRHGRI